MLGGLGGALLAVILPTVLMAFLKLRRRDLSAILEGAGWGINARMRLTHQQARFFTQRPGYPHGTVRRSGLFGFRLGWLIVLLIVGLALAGGIWAIFANTTAAPGNGNPDTSTPTSATPQTTETPATPSESSD